MWKLFIIEKMAEKLLTLCLFGVKIFLTIQFVQLDVFLHISGTFILNPLPTGKRKKCKSFVRLINLGVVCRWLMDGFFYLDCPLVVLVNYKSVEH